jgi:hypothetical protein
VNQSAIDLSDLTGASVPRWRSTPEEVDSLLRDDLQRALTSTALTRATERSRDPPEIEGDARMKAR